MSQLGSYLSRLRHKIKQPDIEQDQSNLVARAFRRRLLDEEAEAELLYMDGPAGRLASAKPVAVYQARPNRLLVGVRRFGLIVLAPLLGLGLVAFIVLNTLYQSQSSAPIATETVALSNVPVPAGVRAINRVANINQKTTVDILMQRFIPNYRSEYKGSASFISPGSIDDLTRYYNARMVEARPPPWQIYSKPAYFGDFFTTIYVRSLNTQGAVEAVVLQLETVKKEILRLDPDYYDKQAKVGETVIIISKAWLTPGQ